MRYSNGHGFRAEPVEYSRSYDRPAPYDVADDVMAKIERDERIKRGRRIRRNRQYTQNVVKKLRKEVAELKAKLRKAKHKKTR